MAVAAREKREKPTPVPVLFSFNSVNRPQVKISCSCQFNSASNDAATRSLFLFFALFLCLFIHPTPPSHVPLHPIPSHHPLSSISLSVSRIELSCSSNRQHRESLVQLSCLTDRHFSPIMGVCRHRPASIDTVSGLRGDALISEDTLNIDLTSCRNDPLVLVKDHCLSRLALMHLECRIVMETIITSQACAAGQELCSD